VGGGDGIGEVGDGGGGDGAGMTSTRISGGAGVEVTENPKNSPLEAAESISMDKPAAAALAAASVANKIKAET